MPTDDGRDTAPGERDGTGTGNGTPTGYGDTLWTPDEQVVADARITAFLRWLAGTGRAACADYDELWRWSVTDVSGFWASVWDYFDVLGDRGDGAVLAGGPMPDVRWFAGAKINYARNALRAARTDPDRVAIVYRAEGRAGDGPGESAARSGAPQVGGPGDQPPGRTPADGRGGDATATAPVDGGNGAVTYGELASAVAAVAHGLRGLGVTRGDRVAALVPNIPEAVVAMLATASIGAIWSSCSPDFGPASVIDRFAQIRPKVLIAVDGYRYGGKEYPRGDAVREIVAALPDLAAVVTVPRLVDVSSRGGAGREPATAGAPAELSWQDLGGQPDGGPSPDLEFADVPFDHPLWVVYSSGTTGLPKPIMHGHGGVVLEHLKAISFHQDLGAGDVFCWYTTTGWMMWNYLLGGLLTGATIVLYDGSATHPATDGLWRLAAETGITYLGVGAPYLLACAKAGLRPGRDHDLSALRAVGSTGSPLPPEGFHWVYDAVKSDLLLGSFSGGTDLCTGFVGPCPLLPVRAGVIAAPCLGADVAAYDDGGHPLVGAVGELVIRQPMPSMPVGFWNDPERTRYRDSYYAHFPGVWRHGDWIEMLPGGGCVIYGRSDATLNRGGVRMGTSEFYRVVEGFAEITDSLVVDTGRLGADGKLVLYVTLAEDSELDADLVARLRSALRSALSPRHVPDEIHQVPGIPRTLSGKKLEVPVRKILQGTPVAEAADADALANPDVLAFFVPATK